MEIKQLISFCKVAEAGGLTRAAAPLQLTQAALSRQMTMLETELEVALFHRTGRGLTLTEPGRRLLEHAHLILQHVAHAQRAVKEAAGLVKGTLALGLPPSLARNMVVPLVEAFKTALPEAAMRSVDGLSLHLMELVGTGKLDCAIVYNSVPTENVELTPLAEESLYLVSGSLEATAASPLADAVTLAEVARLPIVAADKSNAVHLALSSAMGRIGKTVNVVHEIANLSAILDMVRNGHGYAVIPLSGVHSCIGDRKLRLHRIRRPQIVCHLSIATPARSADPLTGCALKILHQVVTQQLRSFNTDVEDSIAERRQQAARKQPRAG